MSGLRFRFVALLNVVCCSVVDLGLLGCVVCWVFASVLVDRCLLFVFCCLRFSCLWLASNVCLLHRVWCLTCVVCSCRCSFLDVGRCVLAIGY